MVAYSGAWLSLALVLTALCAVVTYLAWRSRGAPALVKGAGVTLLPLALYFTGTLRLVGTIVDQVASYLGGLVFSPRVWIGVVLAVVGVLLIAGGSALRTRVGAPATRKERRAARAGGSSGGELSATPSRTSRRAQAAPAQDDEMADIEALLRKRGIS